VCAGQSCYFDARCLATSTDPFNGVGCGAGGYSSCRACYVDAYISILAECPELPSPSSPPPPPSPAVPGSITTITLQVVIGFVAAEPIEAFTTARLNNIAVWVAAELGVGPSNVQVIASAASTRVDIIITTATANATAAIEESMASSIFSNASVASSFFGLTVTSTPTITSRSIVTITPPTRSTELSLPDASSGSMLIGALLGALLPMLLGALLGALMLWRLFRRRQRLLEQRCKAEKEQRAMQEMMKAIVLQARARSWLAKRTLQQARADKEALEAAATRVQALMHKKLKLREMKREFAAVLEAARLEQATHETSRRSYESSSDLRTDVRSRAHMPPMQGGVPPLRMSRLDVPPARTDVPPAAASASASARSGCSRFGGMSTRAQPITQPEPAFLAADDERTDWPSSLGRHTYARRALQMADGSPTSLRQLSPPALLPPPPPAPPPPPSATAVLDFEAQTATPRLRPWLDPSTRHLYV
jgi:hypothetical protein